MTYKTVYEITESFPIHSGNALIFIALSVPLPGAIAFFIYAYKLHGRIKITKHTIQGAILFIIDIPFAILIIFYFLEWTEMKSNYLEKKCQIVEGKVENFNPRNPPDKGPPENFTVRGQYFSYSGQSAYFHDVSSRGGPIHFNGQKVRIHYYTDEDGYNAMLKVEVATW